MSEDHDIFVAGLINHEITLKVDGFPIVYEPVRYPFFGVNSTVSGVGYNIARALTTLGDRVHLASMIGRDPAGRLVRDALRQDGIDDRLVIENMEQTAHSVIIFDPSGRRQIHVDLKDIQERSYPTVYFEGVAQRCSLAVICNINFARPILNLARRMGKTIATDVHTISSLDDDYNRDYMAYADILFMSNEALPMPPHEWIRTVQNRYGNAIIMIGIGSQGALLAVKQDNFLELVPAVTTREVVNTIGAGDALFSAFIHFYNRTHDPYDAIRRAVVFASYKIGANGAANGFLTEPELNSLYEQIGS